MPTWFIAHLVELPTMGTRLDRTAMAVYQIRSVWDLKNQIIVMNCGHECSRGHRIGFSGRAYQGYLLFVLVVSTFWRKHVTSLTLIKI